MTRSRPFLDPPSNGKCLDSKEAADEEWCQREACLGWERARSPVGGAFELSARMVLRLSRQRQNYYRDDLPGAEAPRIAQRTHPVWSDAHLTRTKVTRMATISFDHMPRADVTKTAAGAGHA